MCLRFSKILRILHPLHSIDHRQHNCHFWQIIYLISTTYEKLRLTFADSKVGLQNVAVLLNRRPLSENAAEIKHRHLISTQPMHTHKTVYIKTFKIAPTCFDHVIVIRELRCSLLKLHY